MFGLMQTVRWFLTQKVEGGPVSRDSDRLWVMWTVFLSAVSPALACPGSWTSVVLLLVRISCWTLNSMCFYFVLTENWKISPVPGGKGSSVTSEDFTSCSVGTHLCFCSGHKAPPTLSSLCSDWLLTDKKKTDNLFTRASSPAAHLCTLDQIHT